MNIDQKQIERLMKALRLETPIIALYNMEPSPEFEPMVQAGMLPDPFCTARGLSDVSSLISNHYREPRRGLRVLRGSNPREIQK